MSEIENLARLRKKGLLRRSTGQYELRHPEVALPFVAKVEAALARLAPGMDTIVPRKKHGRRRRRGR
jgi:hypothetical protein